MEQTGSRAVGQRFLGNQFFGQVIVEVGNQHWVMIIGLPLSV
jgi:hypothetical protein